MEKQRVNKRRDKKEKSNHLGKIVVRHLPPTMTEKEFLEQVEPLPENDSYYFCPADWSLGQEATCRAYIDMSLRDLSEVLQFRDRFDGYVFVDSKGVEYVAIVEYAPFQCFLKNKARSHDNKVNTIESEPHYQEFLQKLADEQEEASRMGDVKIDFTFENKNDEKVKSTPLLQYLANKKEKRREEARKRNEEKKKHREEQKLLKSVEAEAGKAKEAGGDNKKSGNANNKNAKKEGQASEEGTKNSRSKRKTERDQRRREELEQRKMGQGRDKKKNERQDTKDSSQKGAKNQNQKSNKEVVILKKKSITDPTSVALNTSSAVSAEVSCEVSTRSEVASERESGPSQKEAAKPNPTVLEQSSSTSKPKNNNNSEGASKQKNSNQGDNYKGNNSRSNEERRIRNKDRPSIAIYQPKVRNSAGTEETSPNCKDPSRATEASIFPTDGDTSVPEDAPRNKRFNRRNKQKVQDSKDKADNAPRDSKSSESNIGALK